MMYLNGKLNGGKDGAGNMFKKEEKKTGASRIIKMLYGGIMSKDIRIILYIPTYDRVEIYIHIGVS